MKLSPFGKQLAPEEVGDCCGHVGVDLVFGNMDGRAGQFNLRGDAGETGPGEQRRFTQSRSQPIQQVHRGRKAKVRLKVHWPFGQRDLQVVSVHVDADPGRIKFPQDRALAGAVRPGDDAHAPLSH